MLLDYVMLWPFVMLSLMVIVYVAVRFALDWRDQLQARRMDKYGERYGSVTYYGTMRPNFRTGHRP